MMSKIDDGRRKMPKLKCPYCDKRVADLPSKDIKNISNLVKENEIEDNDIVLKCMHCGNIIGFRLLILKETRHSKCIPILK